MRRRGGRRGRWFLVSRRFLRRPHRHRDERRLLRRLRRLPGRRVSGADVLAAVDGAGEHGGALQRRLLRRSERAEAVVLVVEVDLAALRRHARRRLGVEEVVGEAEVDEHGELADGLVDDAGEDVPGHVQLLQLAAVGERGGQRADEDVAADVDDVGVLQVAHLHGHAAVELVVHEADLVERFGHAADALGDAADEGVVGEDDDGGGGVAEVARDVADESVAVDEDGVELLVEQRRRQLALEVVEADVEVLEHGHLEADVGEDADEAVVADVELVQQRQPRHALGDDAAEAVGVDVEEGEVGEEAELRREVPGDVGAVEVDAGDHHDLGVVDGGVADDAVVGAHVVARPVVGVPLGVRVERAPPRLERDVRLAEPRVREVADGDSDAVVEVEVIGRQVALLAHAGLLHRQQLPVRDVRHFGAGHRADVGGGGEAGGEDGEHQCHGGAAPAGGEEEPEVHGEGGGVWVDGMERRGDGGYMGEPPAPPWATMGGGRRRRALRARVSRRVALAWLRLAPLFWREVGEAVSLVCLTISYLLFLLLCVFLNLSLSFSSNYKSS